MAKLNIDKIMKAVEQDDGTGFCIACGNEQGGCEPDARKYKCNNCEQMKVYGAEELLMML